MKKTQRPSPSSESLKITTEKNQNSVTQNVSINDEADPTLMQANLLSTSTTIFSTTVSKDPSTQTTDSNLDIPQNYTSETEPYNDKGPSSTTSTLTSLTSTKVNNCSFTETEHGTIFETGNPYNSNSRMSLNFNNLL